MSDIEIARKAKKQNIKEIAVKLNLKENDLRPYGHHIAKIDLKSIDNLPEKKSKLILVTAISPTPAGEGKTTTSVGLHDGLLKRTKSWTKFWNERWSSWWWIFSSNTNGTY